MPDEDSYFTGGVGDNREFTVVTPSDVTIYFTNNDSKDSSDDTTTEKYMDNSTAASRFFIRNNQTIHLTQINETTLTDAATIIINKSHKEEFSAGVVDKIVLRTSVANTSIKIRWK